MWPVLRILHMFGCEKVERLTSHYRSLQETHGVSPHENPQQPFFVFDQVAFPNLEDLSLDWNRIMKEMFNQTFSEYSRKLKILRVRIASMITAICPCCFLYTLPNLEEFYVYDGVFKKIFICEELGCKEQHVEAPGKLRHLWLRNLKDSFLIMKDLGKAVLIRQYKNYSTTRLVSVTWTFKVSEFPHLKEV
ncbi:hypothetical protein LWI29_008656 [Acer saccharum]|uniref:Uncharacterized protein n=1 Tax=Acer saccharum TaxID=4024 RepID=A0AA39S475_ACESA|nr:hypothetical protein LWI29_008656 [Acer saccharum]